MRWTSWVGLGFCSAGPIWLIYQLGTDLLMVPLFCFYLMFPYLMTAAIVGGVRDDAKAARNTMIVSAIVFLLGIACSLVHAKMDLVLVIMVPIAQFIVLFIGSVLTGSRHAGPKCS
jgi:hypothetical protein